MTSPKLSLFPTRHDNGLAVLNTFELVSGGDLEVMKGGWAEIRQRMTLEPSPQIFDWSAVCA